ncbi:MAG TPA: hypothetical protein VGJ69_11220 [Pyrinomonadaceae bacterium]
MPEIKTSERKKWAPAAIVVGVLYFVVGFGSAALDPSVPSQMRFTWRLAAWMVSAIIFASHLSYEQFRLRSSAMRTAIHASLAVALGAFLLAGAATVRASTEPSHVPYTRYLLAVVLWPIITSVPAFAVSLVTAAVMTRLRARS